MATEAETVTRVLWIEGCRRRVRMRDWREELAAVGEEVVERRKSGASRMRRALESALATPEMASVIVDFV